MCPRPEGFLVEALAFGLATKMAKDGIERQEYWALDHEHKYARITGELGLILSVKELLCAGIELMKTPLGSIVIARGGCPSDQVIAVMVYESVGSYPDNT
eukprot:11280849-Heterocapsa_arctica.AAC.1